MQSKSLVLLSLISMLLAVTNAVGGFSVSRLPNAELKEKFISFQGIVEGYTDQQYSTFEPMSYKSQVVAGMIYKVTYNVGNGNFI